MIGAYNVALGTSTTVWVTTDPLLEIGNGTAATTTGVSDAMVVYKDGTVALGSTTSQAGYEYRQQHRLPYQRRKLSGRHHDNSHGDLIVTGNTNLAGTTTVSAYGHQLMRISCTGRSGRASRSRT